MNTIKNKWQTAFLVCFVALIVLIITFFYVIIDNGYSTTYREQAFEQAEEAIDDLSAIIKDKDFSKKHVLRIINKDSLIDATDFPSDTVELINIELVFKNDTLQKVKRKY